MVLCAPELGVDEAARLLAAHLGRADVGAVELVGSGAWSQCFGFTLDGRDLVVRFGHRRDDFEKDRRAAACARPGLPVPEVLGLGEVEGLQLAVSARGRGLALETLDGPGWAAVLPSVLDLLDAARSVDLSAVVGRGRWTGDGTAGDQSWRRHLLAVAHDGPDHRTPGWRAALESSGVGPATFDAGLARLSELVGACPEEPHLVHADLLNRNVLVDPATHRIDAVFDWGGALVGDHLYDLATLAFWSAWYPDLAAVEPVTAFVTRATATGLSVADLDARLLACQLHVGLDNLTYSAATGNPALAWIDARVASLLGRAPVPLAP